MTTEETQLVSAEPARFSLRSARDVPVRTRTFIVLGVVFFVDLILLLRRAFSSDISPFDEGYHLSYVQYMHDWAFPRQGDPMGSWSEQMYACNRTHPFGQVTAVPCGVDGPSIAYPEGGQNTAAGWPPLYFLITAQIIRPLMAVGLEPVLAGRSASALIWVLGCVALSALVIATCGSHLLGMSAGILAAALPATWALSSYVTPHSTVMVVGVAALFLLLWCTRSERPVWQIAAAAGVLGVLSGLTLPHAIVALGAVSVAAVVLAYSIAEQRTRLVALALALSGSSGAIYVLWIVIVELRAIGPRATQPVTPPEGLIPAIRDNWSLFWPRGLAEVQFLGGGDTQFAVLISYASIALVGYWLLSNEATMQRGVALGVLVAAPILSVAFAILLDFVVPFRYGASLYPLILFLLALESPSRTVRGVVVALSAVSAAVAFSSTRYFMLVPG